MKTRGMALVLTFMLVVLLSAAGCGKSPTEMAADKAKEAVANKVVEKAIESAASKDGQKVDVDIKSNSMTITDKDGGTIEVKGDDNSQSFSVTNEDGTTNITSGAGAKVPEGFPSDVPVYAGAEVLMGGGNAQQGNFTVQLKSADSMENVAGFYKKELVAKGWTEQTSMSQGGDQPMQMLQYAKGDMGVMVMVTVEDGSTMINLSCMKQ